MSLLKDTLGSIKAVDRGLLVKAQERLDSLTKPRGSLGRLEEFASRMVLATGELRAKITSKKIFVFAGDHGVALEGVSAFPKEVTPQMVLNFLRGGAGINVLAKHVGAEVVIVDVGVDFDFAALGDEVNGLIMKKVVHGTGNIRKGPAMTSAEAESALNVGISLALEHSRPGAIFGTGDMGIANTTASSAIVALLSGKPVREVTGRGTGIDDSAFNHKVGVIEDALAVNKADPDDPMDILAKIGGAEIAAIAGLILGAASRGVPVVVDGFISSAGALIATKLSPESADYLFSAHRSVERGHGVMLDMMGLTPILNLDMRLGEGTGSALAIGLIEAGLSIYNDMATFADAGVSEEGE